VTLPRLSALLAVLVLADLCAAQSKPAGSRTETLLAGDDEALWIVRTNADAKTYDVVAKPVEGKWTWIASGIVGRPVAACAESANCHLLIFDPWGYLVYNLEGLSPTGRTPDDPRWPQSSRHVAICASAGLLTPAGGGEEVLALVGRPAGPNRASTAPRSAPASGPASATAPVSAPAAAGAPATSESEGPITLGLFAQADGSWRYVNDCPWTISPDHQVPLLATVAGGRLYVLAGSTSPIVMSYDGSRWQRPPSDAFPPGASLLGLANMRAAPVCLVSVGEDGQAPAGTLALATFDADRQRFVTQAVTADGKPADVDIFSHARFARAADLFRLLWLEGGKWRTAHLGTNGHLQSVQDVGIFYDAAPTGEGRLAMEYFRWGLLIAVVVPLFFTRGRWKPGPFVLPPAMKPAQALRRVAAALIDFIPCVFVAYAVFQPEIPQSLGDLNEYVSDLVRADRIPLNLAGFWILPHLLFIAYGSIAEYKYHATAGKMLLRLRTVGDEGRPPDLRGVLLRNVTRTIEMSPELLGLPIVLMLVTRNHQRLGDMLARTTVIDLRYRPPTPPNTPPDEPNESSEQPPPDEDAGQGVS
jgi:uncharacterized RDD family membrane protein YckC